MNYVIFDLEWNSGYSYVKKTFVNEIIEIGAIKLNNQLKIIDTFKQLIKPTSVKKLSSRCKNLTNITNEEIKQFGVPFEKAIGDFARWSNGDGNVFLTWSNSDLYVLANNCQDILGNANVPFITKYADAQKYCMSFLKRENNNQISLSNCCELMSINFDTQSLHRALSDCYLTLECFKKVYDREKLSKYIHDCSQTYFERLIYKPYMIEAPKSKLFNVYDVKLKCPYCASELERLRSYECINKSFRAPTRCQSCKKSFWTTVRAKKTYDNVEVSIRTVKMNYKRAKKIK